MRTSNSMGILAGVAVAVLLVAAHAQAITDVAYNFPADLVANESDPQPRVLGNAFTVLSAINVTAVGAFDSGKDGFSATIPVAIYRLSGTTWSQLSSTYQTFSGTEGTLDLNSTDGSARFKVLGSPVTLNAGTYAIVAANYGAAGVVDDWSAFGLTPPLTPPVPTFQTASSAITMGNNGNTSETAFEFFGNGLDPTISGPPTYNWGYPTPSFAGATFEFEPVPEAATFGAAGVGLLALVYIGRYARLRSKVTSA